MALLEFTEKGIYCPPANVYIDPWRAVDYAIITHGHSDHARRGMRHYLCQHQSIPILKGRLGYDISVQGIDYGEAWIINGVKFSLHPAGHVIGSAQVRVEYKGDVWVASGDYKVQDDGFTLPFEPVRCRVFITECTFGLPVYKWKPHEELFNDINQWWRANKAEGKISIIAGYSLGKAQRILQCVDDGIGPIFTHGAVENMNQLLRDSGVALRPTTRITRDTDVKSMAGALIIAPPSAINSPWHRRFKPYSTGIASGWMALRGARRRSSVDRGFAISDHADWTGLNDAIEATGAECIITTHGYTNIFSNWLKEKGYQTKVEHTEYEGELSEIKEAEPTDVKEDKEQE
ncbi:MAG: ligase-associated DNA damage response exonuclease [Chitinophagales bacterium]|nr:ligase-associated DNA damage response exonuclease [Chitinophagales bacterium]